MASRDRESGRNVGKTAVPAVIESHAGTHAGVLTAVEGVVVPVAHQWERGISLCDRHRMKLADEMSGILVFSGVVQTYREPAKPLVTWRFVRP